MAEISCPDCRKIYQTDIPDDIEWQKFRCFVCNSYFMFNNGSIFKITEKDILAQGKRYVRCPYCGRAMVFPLDAQDGCYTCTCGSTFYLQRQSSSELQGMHPEVFPAEAYAPATAPEFAPAESIRTAPVAAPPAFTEKIELPERPVLILNTDPVQEPASPLPEATFPAPDTDSGFVANTRLSENRSAIKVIKLGQPQKLPGLYGKLTSLCQKRSS